MGFISDINNFANSIKNELKFCKKGQKAVRGAAF
jgi:hypothetical protein